MTLEETKSKAMQGDLDSIMALGNYYFGDNAKKENKDIDEAISWYEVGAKFGYPRCMILVAILQAIKGHVVRKIAGGDQTPEDAIPHLQNGLHWAEKAKELGDPGAEDEINLLTGEIGMAYFYCALGGECIHPSQQDSINWYRESIRLLKSVYLSTKDPEVYVILAFALTNYGSIVGYNNEDEKLEFSLYNKIVNEYFGKVIHSDICASRLGSMYTYGRGCDVDYDKAVYYFQMAQNAGFDCSEVLSHFKKKMFGGWTLK